MATPDTSTVGRIKAILDNASGYYDGTGEGDSQWRMDTDSSAKEISEIWPEDYKVKYEKLKEFVRGKWKGDCSECAALANEMLNKEQADD
jgi:hypothetical protein